MTSDWVAATQPANQKPWLKIQFVLTLTAALYRPETGDTWGTIVRDETGGTVLDIAPGWKT